MLLHSQKFITVTFIFSRATETCNYESLYPLIVDLEDSAAIIPLARLPKTFHWVFVEENFVAFGRQLLLVRYPPVVTNFVAICYPRFMPSSQRILKFLFPLQRRLIHQQREHPHSQRWHFWSSLSHRMWKLRCWVYCQSSHEIFYCFSSRTVVVFWPKMAKTYDSKITSRRFKLNY